MDADENNLAQNMFLRVLRTKFKKELWAKVEEELLLVCVPQTGSFQYPAAITLDVAESHVMRESKLFLGNYETLNGRSVAVEGNRLMTKEGWPGEPRECKILYEELFYNSAWRKFRVVCIDGALVGGLPPGQVDAQPALPSLAQRTLKNCKAYLESYPENELVLRKIRQYVEQFVASYYIVKGFEHHAREKVRGLLTKSTEDLLCTNTTFRQFHYEDRNMDALSQVIASYMFEGLHGKLFGSMCDIHSDEDANLLELSGASRESVSLSQMGSGKAFAASDLPEAVRVLSRLEACVTPLEKLLCFKETIDAINTDLMAFWVTEAKTPRESQDGPASTEALVTTDELLPLLVFAIVRSALPHMSASLAYAEHFTFSQVQTSELGFCLSTFKAALALMTESRLLNRNRQEMFPASRFNERASGRKSLSVRRPQPRGSAAEALKRTMSVPAAMLDGGN